MFPDNIQTFYIRTIYLCLYFSVTAAVMLIHHVNDLLNLPDIDNYDFSSFKLCKCNVPYIKVKYNSVTFFIYVFGKQYLLGLTNYRGNNADVWILFWFPNIGFDELWTFINLGNVKMMCARKNRRMHFKRGYIPPLSSHNYTRAPPPNVKLSAGYQDEQLPNWTDF